MIFPRKWKWKRPGILLPVFFLALFPIGGAGQYAVTECATAAIGSAFVARSGYLAACHNQAGLGWTDQHSLSLQHSQPYMVLGISVLAARLKERNGAWGTVLSTCGITGLRQSSLWISYGQRLSPHLSAGVGMHFHTFSIPGKSFYHPGVDLALGVQVRLSDKWVLGAHMTSENYRQNMCLSAGFSYSFFHTATCYIEFHARPGQPIQLSQGLEWAVQKRLSLMVGISGPPHSWAGGVALIRNHWALHLALQYVTESGNIPYSSMHYAW